MKTKGIILLLFAICISIFACSCDNGEKDSIKENKVLFEIDGIGEFIIELKPDKAPETVNNFKTLVSEKFYDGLIFHRVIPGFMAQGGDPDGNGMGGSPNTIKGEFSANGFKDNNLKHKRGTVSMARTQDPDSASSQFFICFDDAAHLDGNYAAFGEVIYGMEAVDEIGEAVTDEKDKPLVDVVIKSARMITDEEYAEKYENKREEKSK